MMEGMVNRYTPDYVKDEWAKRDDNPFKDGLVTLSVKQLTECTDYNWLQKVKNLAKMDHLGKLEPKERLYGCRGGSYIGAYKYLR